MDGSVKNLFRKLLRKRLEQPRLPGAELHGDLRDCYKIKLRKQGNLDIPGNHGLGYTASLPCDGIKTLMSFKTFFGILLFTTLLAPVPAEVTERDPEINPQHPERYVVVSGDTLWDISGRFLTHPWRWKDLWHNNPQIENPHLIYPGDVITLRLVGGRVVAGITRGGVALKLSPTGREQGGGLVKLSPTIRESTLVQPIPTIPLDAIQPFLAQVRVTAEGELDHAAYVIGQIDRRLASVTGDSIYVRGIPPESTATHYSIYRIGRPYYRQTEKGDPLLLGVEAIPVGEAELKRSGDPATFLVMRASIEILAGDRLLPEESPVFDHNFIPYAPDFTVEAQIIDVMGGLSRVARLQTAVLDRGREDGLEVGHVLAVYQSGDVIIDSITKEPITLPEERAGLLMVFRVFDRVSYALVLEAQREIHLLDMVRTPQP
ncbi:hypothetical protein CCP3SC15_700013 [Gammaproteobacteria bacterium]